MWKFLVSHIFVGSVGFLVGFPIGYFLYRQHLIPILEGYRRNFMRLNARLREATKGHPQSE